MELPNGTYVSASNWTELVNAVNAHNLKYLDYLIDRHKWEFPVTSSIIDWDALEELNAEMKDGQRMPLTEYHNQYTLDDLHNRAMKLGFQLNRQTTEPFDVEKYLASAPRAVPAKQPRKPKKPLLRAESSIKRGLTTMIEKKASARPARVTAMHHSIAQDGFDWQQRLSEMFANPLFHDVAFTVEGKESPHRPREGNTRPQRHPGWGKHQVSKNVSRCRSNSLSAS